MLGSLRRQGAAQARGIARRAFASDAAAADPTDFSQVANFIKTDEGRKEFAQVQMVMNDLKRQEAGSRSAPIDWAMFSSVLGEDLVGQVQKLHQAGLESIEKMDVSHVDSALGELKKMQTQYTSEAEAFGESAVAEAANIKQEIAQVEKEEESLETVTIDDILEAKPELRKKIDDDISKGNIYDD